MNREEMIERAKQAFGKLIEEDLDRIEGIRKAPPRKDFLHLSHVKVGIMPGDGIGPYIMKAALLVARKLLKKEIADQRVEFVPIKGMTIEERARQNKSLPPAVLEACKACDILVKGPFVTPRAGDRWPNLLSANSLLRRQLQLYAAVRPIRIPEKGIDWTFFRENIEGEYIWGNKGICVGDDLAIDFKILPSQEPNGCSEMHLSTLKVSGKTNITVQQKPILSNSSTNS